MSGERVAVALSGGVDSAVTAALLLEQGNEVFGVSMRLWQEPPQPEGNCPQKALCDPTLGAQQVAAALGIEFHVVDAAVPFKQHVVDRFIAEYSAGRTPNPCLYCNRHLKFGALLEQALALGADRLATGHYARIRRGPDGIWELLKGMDERKDQSYVLYALGQRELSRAHFPLGTWTKDRVREAAREWALPTAHNEESQDLCFVLDNDYRRFLRRYAPQALRPGPIVDRSGREIGQHRGLPGYTIGQRSGIGIAAPQALYVLGMDVERNALIVGPRHELGRDHLVARQVRWVRGQPPQGVIPAQVKIRYRTRPVPATVTPLPEARAEVRFAAPLRDITPGQGAVFYDGQLVLGGGLIAR